MSRARWPTLLSCAVVWGGIGAALLLPIGRDVVLPGPLTTHHAVLVDDCAACHCGADSEIKGLLHGLVTTDVALAESRRCLECHDWGEHGLHAHVRDPAALAEHTANVEPGPPSAAPPPPTNDDDELACHACHREHRGRTFDMKAVADATCQACHRDGDDSFPDAHPDLEKWPPPRAAIAFHHGNHRAEHFPEAELAFACAECHTIDARDGTMTTASYEASCTSCHHHDERIAGAGRIHRGVPVLRIPGADIAAVATAGSALQGWPADAADDHEEPPGPFVNLLLRGGTRADEIAADIETVSNLDLVDLENASEAELAAVGRYLSATRALFDELARDPETTLRERLARATGLATDHPSLTTLAEALPANLVRAALQTWQPAWASSPATEKAWSGAGSWVRDDDVFTIRYRPRRHADPVLTALHDVAAHDTTLWRSLEEDGRCTQCHARTEQAVAWHARSPQHAGSLTPFSHAPHLLVAGERDCARCHQIGEDEFGPEFESMSRALCAECHRPDGAPTRCTQCHRYH